MTASKNTKLSLGPIQYYWDRDTVFDFYKQIAETPVDIVYLGETVCSKRRLMRDEDWLEIAAQLKQAGKEVVLSSDGIPTKSKTASKRRRKTSSKGKSQPSLAPYVKKRMKIRRKYKGKLHVASVRSNGTINYKGNVYNSPSMAGKAVTKRSTHGWLFWRYKNRKGEWVKLNELRKK